MTMTTFILPVDFLGDSSVLSLHLTFSCLDNLLLTNIFLDVNQHQQPVKLPQTIKNFSLPFTHYFSKLSYELNVPHQLSCQSTFQQKVLQALRLIPYATTVTYGELAAKLRTHPRAIGQALKSNPLPLIYPCHRVISKQGLGGFMGSKMGKSCDLKLRLLELEKSMD